jgi:hypothetical protein
MMQETSNWQAIGSAAAAASFVCVIFGYVFKLAVKDEIRTQMDIFRNNFGSYVTTKDHSASDLLFRERIATIQKQLDNIDEYAHNAIHVINNRVTELYIRGGLKESRSEEE